MTGKAAHARALAALEADRVTIEPPTHDPRWETFDTQIRRAITHTIAGKASIKEIDYDDARCVDRYTHRAANGKPAPSYTVTVLSAVGVGRFLCQATARFTVPLDMPIADALDRLRDDVEAFKTSCFIAYQATEKANEVSARLGVLP